MSNMRGWGKKMGPGGQQGAAAASRFVLLAGMACGVLAGCGGETAPGVSTAASTAVPAATPVADAPQAAKPELAPVTDRAEAALREQRLFTPPGDNAFELFVEAVEASPDDTRARLALQDLFPYAVLNVEQRLAAKDREEVARVLGLMVRAQPDAPALPRLQRALAALHLAEREATLAAEAAAAAADAAATNAVAAGNASLTSIASESRTLTPSTPPPVERSISSAAPTATSSSSAPAQAPGPMLASLAPVPTQTPTPPVDVPASSPASASMRMPKVLRQTPPRYPVEAGRRGTEGRVELAFTVTPSGRVADVEILESEPRGVFDRAAITSLKSWRFEESSQPVRTTRTFEFRLD